MCSRTASSTPRGSRSAKGLPSRTSRRSPCRDLTGTLRAWIDVGSPDAERLHKASKASPRVAVYPVKDAAQFVRQLGGGRIHRADAIEIYGISRLVLDGLLARLERRTAFELAVTDRHLY